jgi:hypothetical protein
MTAAFNAAVILLSTPARCNLDPFISHRHRVQGHLRDLRRSRSSPLFQLPFQINILVLARRLVMLSKAATASFDALRLLRPYV